MGRVAVANSTGTKSRRIRYAAHVAAAVAIVIATVGGCSAGGSGVAPTAESTPAVSLPGDRPGPTDSAKSASQDAKHFSTAVEFTRLTHLDDHGVAGGLVADNSPAARYIAHQTAYRRAYELNGNPIAPSSPNDVTIDGDAKTGAIKIDIADGDRTISYTWKNFTFDPAGKITARTGKSGPIDKALWSKSDSAKAHDVTAKLVSAYVSNGGDLIVVAEIASPRRAIRVEGAVLSPNKGYRQEDTAGLYTEVGKGEKTMTVFDFPNAALKGKLKIELGRIDTNDPSSSYQMGSVTLTVK